MSMARFRSIASWRRESRAQEIFGYRMTAFPCKQSLEIDSAVKGGIVYTQAALIRVLGVPRVYRPAV